MFQIVNCTNCGRSSRSPDEKVAWASIRLSDSDYCNSCKHSHEKEQHVRFCSTRCLVLFVQRNGDRLLKLEQDLVTNAEQNSWVTEERPGIGLVRVNKYVNPLYDVVPPPDPNPQDDLTPREKEYLAANPDKYIMVIKWVRERTRLGLKEAKDLVDKFRYKK